MHERYLEELEFTKIIAQLAEHTSFSAGRELALALRPSSERDVVAQMVAETSEAKALLAHRPDFGVGAAHDVRAQLERAAIGSLLDVQSLLDVRDTLHATRNVHHTLMRVQAEYPLLADWAQGLDPLELIYEEIGRCLDDDGRVLDTASPELMRLRAESELARSRLMERLRRLVNSASGARYLQEQIITERGSRYVIPLKAEYKGRIPGIIHDQSSSGATIFIEPLDTVELNNNWQSLQIQVAKEVERILYALSRMVGDEAETIARDVALLAEIDLITAKARYSYAQHAAPAEISPPRASDWPPLQLVRARHPLLPPETCVPIDVQLGGAFRVLLVTGPNTGGKTVALKTVGLLAAMAQAGLHIPAAEGSRLPIFDGIYADIGDEQSIEASLSTFSSHMTRIIDILRLASSHSLVLLDELGAGTDPTEGAALAQALLEELLERGCLVFCSTHYSQLKAFALNREGVRNASVEFDIETLSPTYQLVIGLPGRSNALAIAQRLGLPEDILAMARERISAEAAETDAILAQVKAASQAAEADRARAAEHARTAARLEQDLMRRLAAVEAERLEVLNAARCESLEEIERTRAELRQIRATWQNQGHTPAASTQEAERELVRMARAVAPERPRPTPGAMPERPLQVGDTVFVNSLQQTGELLSLSPQGAEVRVGGFRLRTDPAGLRFYERPAPEPQPTRVTTKGAAASPGMELDMRGWRAEEVAPELDKYLNDAYLAELPWVRIIHGRGMGILREVVRQQIELHPLVASHRPGQRGEGDDGVTVITLAKRHPDS
ncbi:MAG: endonuclease MutS2 [Chloroflexi bacterium]|nr:endonuclease MutS2 [Chloroflexota bacterium]